MNSSRKQRPISFLWWLLILATFLLPGCERGQDQANIPTMDRLDLVADVDMLVRCSDTLIMKNHGAVTLGANLMDAFKKLDMVEHTAHILWLAHVVRGGVEPLPAEAVEKLLATRRLLGIRTTNTLENRCGVPLE